MEACAQKKPRALWARGQFVLCLPEEAWQSASGTSEPRSGGMDQDHVFRSKRSAFITFVQAATKSLTNFSFASLAP